MNTLVFSGLLGNAELDELLCHVKHSGVEVSVLNAEFFGGIVVERVSDGLTLIVLLSAGPAEGSVLVDDGLGIVVIARNSLAQDESPVGSLFLFDGEQMSRSNLTDIDATKAITANALLRALEDIFAPLDRG